MFTTNNTGPMQMANAQWMATQGKNKDSSDYSELEQNRSITREQNARNHKLDHTDSTHPNLLPLVLNAVKTLGAAILMHLV